MDTDQRTYLRAAMQHRRAVNSIRIPAPIPTMTEGLSPNLNARYRQDERLLMQPDNHLPNRYR